MTRGRVARRPRTRAAFLAAALPLVALLVACGGDSASPGGATGDAAGVGFPTGPAVLVEVGYEPPTDRVDSTGAFLPANGRPTLVYVDAIW